MLWLVWLAAQEPLYFVLMLVWLASSIVVSEVGIRMITLSPRTKGAATVPGVVLKAVFQKFSLLTASFSSGTLLVSRAV
jgi:hypothetical protein